MNERLSWDDADLQAALDRYREELQRGPYSPVTVESFVAYGLRFLDWRTGEYVADGMPATTARRVPTGKRDLAGLHSEMDQYEAYLKAARRRPGAIRTYVRDANRFLHSLDGSRARVSSGQLPVTRTGLRPAKRLAPIGGNLAVEFARIRDGHREAIVRTVARMAVPGSVGRVFQSDTSAALVDLLPQLPVARLATITDQTGYRAWFEAALDPVGSTILRLNPPRTRSSVHPGYKWGHGTKVLSLFIRDLVLYSRYFTDEEARRIEPWLYCPVDQIVMKGLRRAGVDPGVDRIRKIDEMAFWRIQDHLTQAAATSGVPRVWFDDVWSETRD